MKKNIKKMIAVLFVSGTFAGYVFSQKNASANPTVALNDSQQSDTININSTPVENSTPVTATTLVTTTKPVATPKPVTTPKPVVTPTPAPKPAGAFKDGTYTGIVANAYYGNIQVQAVIRNGALADVIFLQHPSDRNTSVRINSYAMPQLKSEAIQIQSANVDTVSGASASSGAFVQSLRSALNQAKNV